MIKPMLAESADKPFDSSDWLFEHKLDGVRCVAHLAPSGVLLQARSGLDITHKFPELKDIGGNVRQRCVVDGELVAMSFNAIQHRIHQEKPLGIKVACTQYPVHYEVFDILYCDGESVMPKPLVERKVILGSVMAESYQARLLSYRTGHGTNLFDQVRQANLEGIMAKRLNSPYLEGKRSDQWLKVKCFKEAVFHICGITEGENERATTLGSVILGEMTPAGLRYVGNVGSGFNAMQLQMLLHLLEFFKSESPLPNIKLDKPVKFWTRPDLKIEVRFLERTPDGMLRFPTFRKLVK